MSLSNNSIFLSFVSGLIAAITGFVGKIGLDSNHFNDIISSQPGSWSDMMLRVLLMITTLLLNSSMLALFSRALSLSEVSAVVTSINTATNLALTTILSVLVFQEPLSSQWCCGTLLVMIGVSLVIADDDQKEKKD